jgi:predicted transport protein
MPSPADMIKEIERITGRSAEEWISLLPAGTHAEQRAWLKEQGLHGNHAGAVLWWKQNGAGIEAGGEPLIDRQYAGKESLRPIYDRLVETITALGEDVEPGPRGTYVSFGRPKQFALVQPSTKTRVDLGLRLPGAAAGSRLLEAGSFGSGNITHKVGLSSPDDVDAEIEGWLREAYRARG